MIINPFKMGQTYLYPQISDFPPQSKIWGESFNCQLPYKLYLSLEFSRETVGGVAPGVRLRTLACRSSEDLRSVLAIADFIVVWATAAWNRLLASYNGNQSLSHRLVTVWCR